MEQNNVCRGNVPSLYMICGLPGSGKTSFAEKISKDMGDFVIHSSDALREEMFGSTACTDKNNEVFSELHRRIKADLILGKNVLFDATNTGKKKRMAFLKQLSNVPCNKVGIVTMVPYETCVENNNSREKPLPASVIDKYLRGWSPPYYHEGFNRIGYIFDTDEIANDQRWKLNTLFDGDCGIDNFNQGNSHHTLTLGAHCRKASGYVQQKRPDDKVLQMAALLHDVGKIMTKTTDEDGECHYYQHHNVGSYLSMFYSMVAGFDDNEASYIANLIYYHMHPYMSWKHSAKSEQRDRAIMGEKMYEDVLLLHEADEYAH